MKWEADVLLWIQDNLRNAVLDPICWFFGFIGAHGEFAIVVALLLLIIPKTRRTGCVCACSLGSSYILGNLIIKKIVERPRPYEAVEGLTSLVGNVSGSSFPSGHATATFGCLFAVFLLMPKKFGIPALCASVFMAYSRLHVGVHYPTDVIAGSLIGIFFACLYSFIYKKKFAPKQENAELLKGK
ncbi:MAG: phosphatase PAP2 family protein [Ruminococcus sp.]|nr:phosphatase PAP2 family protein [Ruminococcus sp.]